MFKTGICTRGSLSRMPRRRSSAANVSYRLLKYGAEPDGADVIAFEQVIRGTRLTSGVYRTTYRRRMADVDEAVATLLPTRISRTEPEELHDWGASDCLAAREWAERLWTQFPQCRVTASDISFFLLEVSAGPDEAYVLEENGAPLQYVKPPFVINLNAKSSLVYVVNNWLHRRARRRAPQAAAAALQARWQDVADTRVFDLPPWRVERIPLLHPEALALFRRNPAFCLKRHSVFVPLDAPVAVIRTMNVLNRGYFSPERLQGGIQAVFDSLRDGGLWIVGRTKEELAVPENHATIWEKSGNVFREVVRLRSGSELAPLVHEFRGA